MAKPTKTESERKKRLMPGGIPRYVRIYDADAYCDRYTVVYTGRYRTRGCGSREQVARQPYYYHAMGAAPYHPQGFCLWCSDNDGPVDAKHGQWPPAVGRRNHLGVRIEFKDLPRDCQEAVIDGYKSLWNL